MTNRSSAALIGPMLTIMEVRRPSRGAGVRLSAAIAAMVLLAGASLTWAAARAVGGGEQDRVNHLMASASADAARTVAAETARYVDVVRNIANSAGAQDALMLREFRQIVRSIEPMRLAGATSIAYMVPAGDDDVAATQALWRSRGQTDLVLRPQGTGREHIFSVFSEPLDGSTDRRDGIDASQAAAPSQALNEARRSDNVAISDAYRLIVDADIPVEQRQLSFALTAPVRGTAGEFRGWILMGIRGQSFLTDGLPRMAPMDVTLLASDADGAQTPVASLADTTAGERDLHRSVEISVAQRRWRVQADAATSALPGHTSLPQTIAMGGFLMTALLAALVFVLASGRSRASAAVTRATTSLRLAEEEARDHAELLSAVLDNISDGVGVVDNDGSFILHNPAARALLGVTEDSDDPVSWQDHYGIFLPDGSTPFPTEDLPLVRALKGEISNQVPMVIRNAGRPDGVVITVSARPLATDGAQHGAVAVFHDITDRHVAEEALRASKAELEQINADLGRFAATASHDLRAPLHRISGFAQLLSIHHADQLDDEALDYLTHVTENAHHLGHLIANLLDVSQVSDQQMQRQPVDLNAGAHRVLTNLSTAIADTGADITVDVLPVVEGDSGLIERLLQNLVANAIKYQPAGQSPRICISATPDTDPARTVVQITDNGIGIDAQNLETIFQPFRRLVNDQDYGGGTGLGLTVCRRIVERHGGLIWATPSSSGPGTTISCTLPIPGLTSCIPDLRAPIP